MNLIRSLDWQMISFVTLSLVNEYLINVHLPRVYYWNGESEYQAKKHNRKLSRDKQNDYNDSDDEAA